MSVYARLVTFCTTDLENIGGQFLGVTLKFETIDELDKAKDNDFIDYVNRYNSYLPGFVANDVLVLKKVETNKNHMKEGYKGSQTMTFRYA